MGNIGVNGWPHDMMGLWNQYGLDDEILHVLNVCFNKFKINSIDFSM